WNSLATVPGECAISFMGEQYIKFRWCVKAGVSARTMAPRTVELVDRPPEARSLVDDHATSIPGVDPHGCTRDARARPGGPRAHHGGGECGARERSVCHPARQRGGDGDVVTHQLSWPGRPAGPDRRQPEHVVCHVGVR